MIERVAYTLEGRLPSNNGYVIQIMRMCDGLQKSGYDPVLFYSNRDLIDEDLHAADPFDFFGIDDEFDLASVPYLDFKRFHGRVSEPILRPFLIAANVLFWILIVIHLVRSDADLCITRDWPIAYLLVKFGVPTVFEIHKVQKPSFSARGQRAIGAVAGNENLRKVVTLTEPTADKLVETGIPREKIQVEPDGVDLTPYQNQLDRGSARERLGIQNDAFLAVYTGSLKFEKGIPELLDAVAEMEGGDLLLVGGTDGEQRRVKEHIRTNEIDNVTLAGRVQPREVPTYQWAADVLVLPPTNTSAAEKHHPESTSPLKMFEYMAAVRPIVATTLPGILDVLSDEENALLVPPNDSQELRRAIERIRENGPLAERLATQAASDVQQYTWERRADRIVSAAERREP